MVEPPRRHHRGDRVLEGSSRHDVARPDVAVEQRHRRPARCRREVVEPIVDRGNGRASRQRHADGFAHRGHRVGGEHPRARAGPRAGSPLDGQELVVVDGAVGVGTDALEHVDDRYVLARVAPGKARAAVEEHRGQIVPGRRHQHPRERLVATGDRHHAVEPLGMHHELHGIGDHLARDERSAHSLVAHRNAVRHGDGREDQPDPAGVAHAGLGALGQLGTGEVARRHLVAGRDDTDLRFAEVVARETDCSQHRPRLRRARGLP